MANASQVPDVTETDLERSDLEEAARELSLDDVDDLSDQELFERIGVALGEIDIDALEEAQQASDGAEDAADEAEDEAEDAGDEAEDAGDDAEDEAEDADDEAEDATDEAGDEAEDAGDEAEDEAEDADDEAEDSADEAEDATDEEDDGGSEAEPGEYRFEDDPREGIEPVLDLEVGPVALDLLGVEIHVRRVHAVLAANPNGKRNIIGKALAALSTAAAAARSEDEGSSDEDADQDEEDGDDASEDRDDASEDRDDTSEDGDDDEGLLHTITAPARGLARGAKKVLGKD
jgi:hypothetical protein